ncbi:MAG: PEP-CTERM sorting domain-containing protein [Candidatus Poribacteria bacterium]|nr:PEP-CTERM sorting domain-containing protein [Candidatus Poribacteria bacterium]
MPIGNEIGAFSLNSTSITYQPGEGGSETAEINYEGTIEGSGASGTVLGTMKVAPAADATNGTWTWCGREFAADGATRVLTGPFCVWRIGISNAKAWAENQTSPWAHGSFIMFKKCFVLVLLGLFGLPASWALPISIQGCSDAQFAACSLDLSATVIGPVPVLGEGAESWVFDDMAHLQSQNQSHQAELKYEVTGRGIYRWDLQFTWTDEFGMVLRQTAGTAGRAHVHGIEASPTFSTMIDGGSVDIFHDFQISFFPVSCDNHFDVPNLRQHNCTGDMSFNLIEVEFSPVIRGVWGDIPEPTATPEPTTLALMGLALAGLGFQRRKAA